MPTNLKGAGDLRSQRVGHLWVTNNFAIGKTENKMGTTIMENRMQSTIMQNKMETTIMENKMEKNMGNEMEARRVAEKGPEFRQPTLCSFYIGYIVHLHAS